MRNPGRKYFLEKSQFLFGFSFGLHIAGQCCGRIQREQILSDHIRIVQPCWNPHHDHLRPFRIHYMATMFFQCRATHHLTIKCILTMHSHKNVKRKLHVKR
jgi:hypothetical protein